jgi:mono/diheme cytochrome c family protein
VSSGCGGCHTLKAAGTRGQVGPDFDTSEKLTVAQIEQQMVVGNGGMPSFRDRLSSAQRAALARFIHDATHPGARGASR